MNRVQLLVIAIMFTVFLAFSGIATSESKVKVFKPDQKLKPKQFSDLDLKRIIAEITSERDLEVFKKKGCVVKHRLKDSTSFDCPVGILSELKNFRESRVFHIMDLEADQQIGADQVWAEGIDGSEVSVVILDTGIDSEHIELSDSYLGGYDFVNNDNTPEDDHGHGTHVAGIITGNGVYSVDGNYAKGVAPSSGVYMLKVCTPDGFCGEDDMMAAMEYAVNNLDAKIMSISIGGGNFGSHCDSDPLATKVNWVVDNGITTVVASGNDGAGVSSPACASKAIAVGAVDSGDAVQGWSNRGSALDIVAPGVDILSTYSCLAAGDCSSYWYAWMDGTSMATPHVSGVAALLLDADPTLTDSEIKNALYTTASFVSQCYREVCFWTWCWTFSVTCTSDITGAGVVNAYDAYLEVKPSAECTTNLDCDDGSYCNGDEACEAGECQPGTPVDCSWLSDQCNNGVCDEVGDSCVSQPKSDGTLCDDGLYCTVNDVCTSGMCGGEARDCSAFGDQCNDGVCDEDLNQCLSQPKVDGTSCDDGLYCNVGETCQSGVCTGGATRDCDDFDICTTDSCNEATDSCEHSPAAADGTLCDDGLYCTVNDVCTSGMCGGEARDCSDVVACTIDSCDEGNDACVNTADDPYCDNGLYCDGFETCDALLGCQAGTPVECDDYNECTTDSCNEGEGSCEYMPVADDTACAGGVCCGGTCMVPACLADVDCNDGDACTEDICFSPGTCSAFCDNEEISTCGDDDGCCPAGCDYTNDNDCQATTKCWSAEYNYLRYGGSQFKKFCKCAQGTYGYSSRSYSWGLKTVYQYKDTGDNENWEVNSRSSYFSVYRVKCTDGSWYYTNQDHYFG